LDGPIDLGQWFLGKSERGVAEPEKEGREISLFHAGNQGPKIVGKTYHLIDRSFISLNIRVPTNNL
jgi:hypothetical protein